MSGAALPLRTPVVGFCLCALALAVPALAQQRTTLTRKERPLASLPFDSTDARSVVVSPDGTRGAYVRGLKGGAVSVVIDGNPMGLPYDQVGRNVVAFSPDSRRTAFAGRFGGQWYVVTDGAESEPFDNVVPESITFSPDGERVAVVAEQEGKALVVTDGTQGKRFDSITEGSLTFSVDGQRLAYVARAGGHEFLVLNDVEGKAYDSVGRPCFSRDGRRLAYAASANGRSFVVLDGNEHKGYDAPDKVHALSLSFSPDGQRLAWVVGPPGKTRAVIDGVEGKPCEHVFDDSLAFSPDGGRFAYMAQRTPAAGGFAGAAGAVVVTDGKEGRAHDGVVPGSIRFSLDGRRIAYLAERAGRGGAVRRCAVIDGVEGKPYDWVRDAPAFSPDGRHYAYVAQRRPAPANAVAVANPPGAPPAADGLAAQRAALIDATGQDVAAFECFAVVDGVEAAPYPWVRGDLLFTPDGRRLAYLAAAPDERFADAGEIPADPTNPAAGGRLIFEKVRGQRLSPGMVTKPVKLLVVEEQIGAE